MQAVQQKEEIPGSPVAGRKIQKIVADLSKKMMWRQTPEELSQKHILPEESANQSVSSNILQAKHQLEQEKAKNSLNRRLSYRPTKEDLKLRNILKGSVDNVNQSQVSGSNESISNSSFEKKQVQLKSILKKRPEKSELKGLNILKGSDVSLVEAQERERKQMIEDRLQNHLLNRPEMNSLKNSKILFFSDEIEVCSTYKKTEYNRKPDQDSTFKKLTPQLKSQIREELNEYKRSEMLVHEDSAGNTCFH